MNGWDEHKIEMTEELYKEVMDEIVGFAKRIVNDDSDQVHSFAPMIFVASYPKDDSKGYYPDFMSFVIGAFEPDTKHQTMRELGKAVAVNQVQLSAVFFLAEAWRVRRDNVSELPQGSISNEPDRDEIIAVSAVDIARRYLYASIPLTRGMDDNRLIAGEPEIGYREGEHQSVNTQSPLLDSLMAGYLDQIHVEVYGVGIDPDNPLKMVEKDTLQS